jgi:exopolyphosphatase/guanosine-5'-triphosphate,3'-diphosphate pyrophosphatase
MPKHRNRIAAIDMGTNSFHLVIVELKQNGSFVLLDREREVLRLGSQKGKDLSLISKDETIRAVQIIKNFVNLANHYNAKIKAIATSAVREASNQKEFVDIIYDQTGVTVEVVDGRTEASLIFLGIKKALPIDDKKVICVDIGGGSTEFMYAMNGKLQFAESVKIGAVRLSKLFFPDFIVSEKAIKECSDYVQNQILSNNKIKTDVDVDFGVGVSGTVETIYYLSEVEGIKKNKLSLNNYQFSNKDLEKYYETIINLKTPAERASIPGMESKRADIIPAGMIILKKIFDLFKLEKMKVSEYALREGIILNTAEKMLV